MSFDEIPLRMMKLGVDRAWLALHCDYKLGTLAAILAPNGNLSHKTDKALRRIEEALDREEARQQNPVTPLELHQIVLRPTDDEFNNWNRQANKENMIVKDWCMQTLNEAAAKILAGQWDSALRPKEAIYKTNTNRSAHLHAAAGSPILSEVQDWDGADDTVLVKINGLSMSPLFADGEVIAMKHKRASSTPYAAKGKIYLFAYEGGYTVKKYNTRKATKEEIEAGISYVSPTDNKHKVRVLQSINPDFPEIVLKEEAEWFAWMPK
jgi:Peptidase S24-like